MDMLALAEGSALLGQGATAVLEMAGTGGQFEATDTTRIALTGAPMRASLGGERLAWNASHVLPAGTRLEIGPTERGTCGYITFGGGLATAKRLKAQSAHLAAGIGRAVQVGDSLPIGADTGQDAGLACDCDDRFGGGTVRIVPSLQTSLFPEVARARFEATRFVRDARGNRMGVPLRSNGPGFDSPAGLSILSEVIMPGDIQITGDGTPFVLLAECQTTGGYPRIGAVIPADLPLVAQARAGDELKFVFVTLDDAVEIERREAERRLKLRDTMRPLVRDPAQIPDLLSYQLISGAVAGNEDF